MIRQLTRVLSSYLGVIHLPGFPYFNEQSADAWLGICFIVVWLTRRHLVYVFRTAISYKSSGEADEPMRYRAAIIGFLGGSLVALIAGMWTNLDMMYRDGALAQVSFFKIWVAETAFNRLGNWLYHPTPPDRV